MKTNRNEQRESRRTRRAKLLREGKSWRQACLMSGYSLSAANRGPRAYFEHCPGTRREFVRLAEDQPYPPEVTRRIAKNRLMRAVLEGKPSNVSREIELLGKFREHDWWVHGSDVQVGIFAELASPEGGQMLDAMAGKLSEYSDGQDATAQSVPEPKQPE